MPSKNAFYIQFFYGFLLNRDFLISCQFNMVIPANLLTTDHRLQKMGKIVVLCKDITFNPFSKAIYCYFHSCRRDNILFACISVSN